MGPLTNGSILLTGGLDNKNFAALPRFDCGSAAISRRLSRNISAARPRRLNGYSQRPCGSAAVSPLILFRLIAVYFAALPQGHVHRIVQAVTRFGRVLSLLAVTCRPECFAALPLWRPSRSAGSAASQP